MFQYRKWTQQLVNQAWKMQAKVTNFNYWFMIFSEGEETVAIYFILTVILASRLDKKLLQSHILKKLYKWNFFHLSSQALGIIKQILKTIKQ